MTRDHLLGFPALALADIKADSRTLRYPLGVPQRSYDEVHARAQRRLAPLRARIAFETGDHTPEHMRPPAAPAAPDDGWIEWGGGERPVRGVVDVRFRSGRVARQMVAEGLWWSHDDRCCRGEIVAYRVSQ